VNIVHVTQLRENDAVIATKNPRTNSGYRISSVVRRRKTMLKMISLIIVLTMAGACGTTKKRDTKIPPAFFMTGVEGKGTL
jgi:hypothetical protein